MMAEHEQQQEEEKEAEVADDGQGQVAEAAEQQELEGNRKGSEQKTLEQRSSPPPSGEAAAFRRVFNLLDTDSDGFISAKELNSALREPEIKKFIGRTYVLQLLVEREDHEQIFQAMDSKCFSSRESFDFKRAPYSTRAIHADAQD